MWYDKPLFMIIDGFNMEQWKASINFLLIPLISVLFHDKTMPIISTTLFNTNINSSMANDNCMKSPRIDWPYILAACIVDVSFVGNYCDEKVYGDENNVL